MNSWFDDLEKEISSCKQAEKVVKSDKLSSQNEIARTTFDQKELQINRVNDIPTPKQIDQIDSFGDQMHLEVEEDARNHIGIGDEVTQRNGEDQDDHMDHTESNGGHGEDDSPNG